MIAILNIRDMNYWSLQIHSSYTLTFYMQKNYGKIQHGMDASVLNSLKNSTKGNDFIMAYL